MVLNYILVGCSWPVPWLLEFNHARCKPRKAVLRGTICQRPIAFSKFQIKVSHFQNETNCKTFLVEMSFSMRITNHFHISSFPHSLALTETWIGLRHWLGNSLFTRHYLSILLFKGSTKIPVYTVQAGSHNYRGIIRVRFQLSFRVVASRDFLRFYFNMK